MEDILHISSHENILSVQDTLKNPPPWQLVFKPSLPIKKRTCFWPYLVTRPLSNGWFISRHHRPDFVKTAKGKSTSFFLWAGDTIEEDDQIFGFYDDMEMQTRRHPEDDEYLQE